MARKKTNPFATITPADEAARTREVEALLEPRRATLQDLPIERIRPNPYQARTSFEGLEELAAVIRAQGFVSRLRVRPDPHEDGYFQLVFGERRLRAARLAELETVPCEIAEHTDAEMMEIGLAENIQRRDLYPLEEARAFQTFIEEQGYSIRRLAERLGKGKGYIENRLALLKVPEDVQEMVEERPDTLRAAREIGKLESQVERRELITSVLDNSLSDVDVRREVEQRVQRQSTTSEDRRNTHVEPTEPAALRGQKAQLSKDEKTIRRMLRGWQVMLTDGLHPEVAKALKRQIDELQAELRNLKKLVK